MKKNKNKYASLSRVIRRVDDLPTLPSVIIRITEQVNNPRSSAKDLARVIVDDQVLTARLLKLVNSSFYGFPQKISTVTDAIVLLGFDAIRNLLLTTSIFNMFTGMNKKKKAWQEKFWDHSLGCAVGAKVIGNHIRYDKVEELFVSGLLHDIGKIVEMLFFPEDFDKVASNIKEKNTLMKSAEDEVLGYTHADLGKLLAEKWNLPQKLINTIEFHHEPDNAGRFIQEASVVHMADILCRALDIGSGGDDKMPFLNKIAWENLQMKLSTIEPIMDKIKLEYEDISQFANYT
ncbi:MAG: HDOD domain-containing protein [Deltaproteobacteria bacterium]|nr:HDOD domain-containing protein [Deltaproteobacteria bacterium]MBT8373298.1 HDOD domain-containing protein [Deltaproteobacteria bacterium]